jgi:O-antigen/teichoic acid export membrane protein
MSRLDRYFRALATGYSLLTINIVYSLAIIPLALKYLGAESFGLWALTLQIGAIVQLADVGISGAFTRILIDYKDDKSSKKYRETFYTTWLAFSFLGLILFVGLIVLSPWIVKLLAIPQKIAGGYQIFLYGYAGLLGLWFAFRPFGMLLFIHQRVDILNIISAVGLIISFFVVWIALIWGWGLWALLAGLFTAQQLSNLVAIRQVIRKSYLPTRQKIPKLSRQAFYEVLDYGKDRFFITVGLTFLQAAPTFLISRLLGLEANAGWTILSRANQLCFQIITRFSDFSFPALTEMFVRGEHAALKKRHEHLMLVGLGLAAFFAFGIATCNGEFIKLWTNGKITSSPIMDAALGLWLIFQSAQRFIFIPVSVSRNLQGVRAAYLLESAVFIALGYALLKATGSVTAVPVILSAVAMMITLPFFFNKAASVMQTSLFGMLSPLAPLAVRVVIPTILLTVLTQQYFIVVTSMAGFVLKVAVIGAVGIILLSSIKVIRKLVKEAYIQSVNLLDRAKFI